MNKFLLIFIIIMFPSATREGEPMDFKNMRYNKEYNFYMRVNEIYKSDYFILNLMKFINFNIQVLTQEKKHRRIK